MKKEKREGRKTRINLQEKGITLVALVVTIIILLILAGVTLSLALNKGGLFSRTQNAVDRYKSAQANELEQLSKLDNELEKYSSGKTQEDPPAEVPKGPNGKQLVTSVTTFNHEKIEGEDSLGNPVTVPGEFKFSGKENDTVEDGIIIEDDEGNQFVWIPVSNTDGDNNATTNPDAKDLIIRKDGTTKVEITLGRYTFATTTPGTPALVQSGEKYATSVELNYNNFRYYEYTNDAQRTNGGVGAKSLEDFITSVETNHGYYLARYEASYKSGSSVENYKIFIKPSISYSMTKTNYTSGMLFNCITQEGASKVSRNMYSGSDSEVEYVESDLINSYAWDTAIVYIQSMGNENYANANRDTTGNKSLMNTGTTKDEKCHIFDMAGNLFEWSTEYSTYVYNSLNYPCVRKGGSYYDVGTFYASGRYSNPVASAGEMHRFPSNFIYEIDYKMMIK